jgi:hypothetical protein
VRLKSRDCERAYDELDADARAALHRDGFGLFCRLFSPAEMCTGAARPPNNFSMSSPIGIAVALKVKWSPGGCDCGNLKAACPTCRVRLS